MTKEEIFTFINSNLACHLATLDGNKPHVRSIYLYRADQNGLIFHTGNMKDLYKQLIANNAVEICFNNSQKNLQVRVSGYVELMQDIALKKEIVAKRRFLKRWASKYKDEKYEYLAIFRLQHGQATIWTMQTNFDKKNYIEL